MNLDVLAMHEVRPNGSGISELIDYGVSARLILRTASAGDRPQLVETLLATFPELFDRAFGNNAAQGHDALLRLASEPFPDGVLWVAALDSEIVGAMQVSTLTTPATDLWKLLGVFGGHLGFLRGVWATMTLNPFLSRPSERGLLINYLAIEPRYQRHGIGRAMLSRAIELTNYEGLPQTMAWLPAGGEAALKLHQELGFSVRKTYRSSLLHRLVGEGTWHYATRPSALPVRAVRPAIEPVAN